MNVSIIAVGHRRPQIQAEIDKYTKLIRPFASLSVLTLRPASNQRLTAHLLRAREGEAMRDKWRARSYPVALSEDGQVYDTPSFARFIAQRQSSGQDLTFNIGGA